MSVVRSLKAKGYNVNRIERFFARYPNGIAKKYEGKLRTEIERA